MWKTLTPGTKISLLGFILTLLVLFSGLIMVYAQTQGTVDRNTAAIVEVTDSLKSLQEDVRDLEIVVVTVQTHYTHIKESLDRIESKLES